MGRPPRPAVAGVSPSVIFVTQLIDVSDPTLGFVVSWVRALTARCRFVTIIANEVRAVPADLDAEVVSLGKERGLGRARRAFGYAVALESIACRRSWSGIMAHMCPEYLILAAPTARLHRIPSFLWYAHPARGHRLRAAEHLADGVLTTLQGSYPRRLDKVSVVGQATDVDAIALAAPVAPRRPFRLLALGRTAPVKGLATVIQGIHLAQAGGLDTVLRIVGPSTTPVEQEHRRQLQALVISLGLERIVSIEDGLGRDGVTDVLHASHALVNATADGSADKVVFEAMAAGRPVIFSNPALTTVLADARRNLFFRAHDPADLAARINSLASLDHASLTAMGRELRRRVERDHSLDRWADQVVAIVTGEGR